MLQEINYKRTEKHEGEFIAFAEILWYKNKIVKKTEKEITLTEAKEKWLKFIRHSDDADKCIILVEKEIDNPETIIEFLEKILAENARVFAREKILQHKKKLLDESRQKEDKALEEEVEEII